jgi:hypothetical protein
MNRVQALEAVFIGTVETKDGRITTPEAVRQLTIEKALQVRLQNEITRKERIPIEDVLEVNNRVFQSIGGTLKANLNQVLTIEKINQMFAEFRAGGEELLGSNGTPCPTTPTAVNGQS